MFITARQLEELHRAGGGNGQVVVPYRARLSPLAQDWVRWKKVEIGYADISVVAKPRAAEAAPESLAVSHQQKLLWWCDGPCGPVKAALVTAARDAHIDVTEIGVDARRIVEAIKLIAREIGSGRAATGVLMVNNGATAMVFANRCPSIRAVLGTCNEAVDQAVKLVAANVLVIEHPYKAMPEAKNLITRFLKGKRELSDDVKRQLKELTTCA
jgi:ribose 5-phosphate isomerase RpiB